MFLINSVNHSFDYKGSFTTNLSLSYGHNPGEYIPTMLDVVGKMLYSRKRDANLYRVARYDDNANGDVSVSAIALNTGSASNIAGEATYTATIADLTTGKYGDKNRKILDNALVAISGLFSPTYSTKNAKLDIRYFYNSEQGFAPSSDLKNIADAIKTWMISPTQGTLFKSDGQDVLPQKDNLGVSLNFKQVSVTPVDLSKRTSNIPSKDALAYARLLSADGVSQLTSDVNNNTPPELYCLYNGILDLWVKFEEPDEVLSTQYPGTENTNQKAQQDAFNLDIQKTLGYKA
jgi:hypothetical protein